MAVTLRYFTEVGKLALQKTICGGIARVYFIFSACTMSSQRKFTFAISSPDEFFVNDISWRYWRGICPSEKVKVRQSALVAKILPIISRNLETVYKIGGKLILIINRKSYMSFRLVPKSVTLNGVMAVILRYFTEFGKPTLQKTICGGIYAIVYFIFSACTMSS